jgi:hypothetical protein
MLPPAPKAGGGTLRLAESENRRSRTKGEERERGRKSIENNTKRDRKRPNSKLSLHPT